MPGADFLQSANLIQRDADAQARARAFAQTHGAPYWQIITEADVPASAYYDDLHIGTAGPRPHGRTRR